MGRIEDAEKKLDFAEYLLRNPFSDDVASGAAKHILAAANLAVMELTKIDEQTASSPRLVQQILEKFEEPEYSGFASTYMRIWRTASNQEVGNQLAKELLRKTKAFIEKVKVNRMITFEEGEERINNEKDYVADDEE